jgi:hypothetical protein
MVVVSLRETKLFPHAEREAYLLPGSYFSTVLSCLDLAFKN